MSALGEGTLSITAYIEKKHSMSLADTADKPNVLAEALEGAIDGGARVIERRILRFVYEGLGVTPQATMTLEFDKQIANARELFENRSAKPNQ